MTDKLKAMSIPEFTRVYDAIPAAVCCMVEYLDTTRPGKWKDLNADHVDLSGYWFAYTDTVTNRRSVWCIRFADVAAHCNAVN